ncbi:3'-5' exonuclease [Rhodococcus koreensis]
MTVRWRRKREDPLRKPWRQSEYLVVDLETTGLDLKKDTIVSYGAVVIRDGRVITAESVYDLVRPRSAMSPEAIAVHTLRPADVADAPPPDAAVHTLAALMTDRVVVAHSAWVEQAFLTRAFRDAGIRFRVPLIDTAALARACGTAPAGQRGDAGLEWLATALGLPVVDPHHALGDAVTTAQVFLVLASRLSGRGYDTARSLVDLTCGDRGLLSPPSGR